MKIITTVAFLSLAMPTLALAKPSELTEADRLARIELVEGTPIYIPKCFARYTFTEQGDIVENGKTCEQIDLYLGPQQRRGFAQVAKTETSVSRQYAANGSIRQIVSSVAVSYGVPAALAHGIVRVESGYRCNVHNGSARGIMQVQSRTARSMGVSGNLMSCRTGLEAGMRYLRAAYDRAGGNWCATATLYNRGIYSHAGRSGYCRMVLSRAREA